MEKSKWQLMIEAIETYLSSYVVFPSEHYKLIAALWALNSHFFKWCDAVPYLAITAQTPRAGKSTLLSLLSYLSVNPENGSGGTASAMFSLMEMHGGQCTLFFDEAEGLSGGAVGTMRSFMNLGSLKGEYMVRKIGKRPTKFEIFCQKAFALIGDVYPTLRDRSIVLTLERNVSPKPFRRTTANEEAEPLRQQIRAFLKSNVLADKRPVAPLWLTNRDQEMYEPLWSILVGIGADQEMCDRFQRASMALVKEKQRPARRHVELEGGSTLDEPIDCERGVRDLASVFLPGEKVMFSTVLVERMLALPDSVWTHYGGTGLTVQRLADLLAPLGLKAEYKRIPATAAGKQGKAYMAERVLAKVPIARPDAIE